MNERDELTRLEGNTPAANYPSVTTYQNPSATEWRDECDGCGEPANPLTVTIVTDPMPARLLCEECNR